MMYKFSPKSQRWIDSCNKKVEFRSSIDLHKCFEKNCTRTRLKPEVMEGECEECSKSGLSLWFCMEHQCHYETECESSHNLFIGRKLLVSDMLLENKNLCEELGVYTMGDIAEIVCICCHENWHAGDILGSSFTSYQNRNKIVRHFDEKNAIDGWETEQASGYDDENYHEGMIFLLVSIHCLNDNFVWIEDIMDPVLKPKQLNSNSKCSVWTCGIHHRNAPCWRCRDAGITRSYCDQHQKHKPNPGGIDHFSDMSANITVDDMLNENNLLCQQLVIIDKETSVFYQNRKNFVVSKCKELGWRSGDLIGNTFDANQRRDSMCCDLLLARDMLAMYSGSYV